MPETAPLQKRSLRGGDEKINILLVDDQQAKLLSYEAILDELGENLIKASSATEALEQLLKALDFLPAVKHREFRLQALEPDVF